MNCMIWEKTATFASTNRNVCVSCDRSCINKTYPSNHTLGTLDVSLGDDFNCISIELQHLICLNKEANKHLVAREKVLQNHTFERVNFVPSSIPVVMQWVGNAASNDYLKLAQM